MDRPGFKDCHLHVEGAVLVDGGAVNRVARPTRTRWSGAEEEGGTGGQVYDVLRVTAAKRVLVQDASQRLRFSPSPAAGRPKCSNGLSSTSASRAA